MPLPTIRLRLRTMMAIVLAVAVCLYVGRAAWRAYRFGTPHLHSAIGGEPGKPAYIATVLRLPFWPAFLHEAAGISWGMKCTLNQHGVDLEVCELASPEIRGATANKAFIPRMTTRQKELYKRLERESSSQTTATK